MIVRMELPAQVIQIDTQGVVAEMRDFMLTGRWVLTSYIQLYVHTLEAGINEHALVGRVELQAFDLCAPSLLICNSAPLFLHPTRYIASVGLDVPRYLVQLDLEVVQLIS